MRNALDDVIIFRWEGVRALALKDYARRKGFTLSAYLRVLLDKFVVSRGLLSADSMSDNKSED